MHLLTASLKTGTWQPGKNFQGSGKNHWQNKEHHRWKRSFFAGFNALTKAEEKVIDCWCWKEKLNLCGILINITLTSLNRKQVISSGEIHRWNQGKPTNIEDDFH